MNRKKEPAVVDGCTYSLATFANGGVGQTNHREHRHHAIACSRRQINLDVYNVRVDPKDGCAYGLEEHANLPKLRSVFKLLEPRIQKPDICFPELWTQLYPVFIQLPHSRLGIFRPGWYYRVQRCRTLYISYLWVVAMDEPMRRVLDLFAQMNSDTLDLHTLFEAGGSDPEAREQVVDLVSRLVREGLLEERGSDFYALTDSGRAAIGNT